MMIEDGELLAWIDGELADSDVARVAAAVAADSALNARVTAHRQLAERLANGFAPLLDTTSVTPRAPTPVVPFAAARASRRLTHRPPVIHWQRYTALAATLMIGIATGILSGRLASPGGVADAQGALVASATLSKVLDEQLSGQPGPTRVTLSFRNHDGEYCRSFAGAALAGIACRDASRWQVRYAAAVPRTIGAYRTAAAGDSALLAASDAMIEGTPLDANGERTAREIGWRKR